MVCVDASPGDSATDYLPDDPPLVEGWYYTVTQSGVDGAGQEWIHAEGQHYGPGECHLKRRFRIAESQHSESTPTHQEATHE